MVSRLFKRKAAAAVLAIEMCRIQSLRLQKKKRKYCCGKWIGRRSMGLGSLNLLLSELREENPEDFKNFTRLDNFMFDEVLECIRHKITKQDTNMRQAISAEERLAATLDFLAGGSIFERSKFSTRIAPNTLSLIVTETLQAIVDELASECIKTPQTEEEWKNVALQFEMFWDFPHCLGSLDGKHINFRPPRSSGSFFRNYKKTDSIVLLALVDAHYKFVYIDVGKNGRCNDSCVFKDSKLWKCMQNNTLGIPGPCLLSSEPDPLPHVIVADDAFGLNENVMKPYPDRNITHEKKIFNYRLSRARRIVENAFGQLANRFQILLKTIKLSVEKVELIVTAFCVLHNFILKRKPPLYLGKGLLPDNVDEDGNLLPLLEGLPQQGGNRAATLAHEYRDRFKDYFNNAGKVPWQDAAVEKGNF